MSLTIVFAYDPPSAPSNTTDTGLSALHDRSAEYSVSAEYEDERTITSIREHLASIGNVIDLPWGPEAPRTLIELAAPPAGTGHPGAPAPSGEADIPARAVGTGASHADMVFNITEAYGSRNRESLMPAIAEAVGIACSGTDAVGLGMSLDKAVTKAVAAQLDIATPGWVLIKHRSDIEDLDQRVEHLVFPVIAKPNTGGSSLGIHEGSRVSTVDELRALLESMFDLIDDRILVEEFVSGRELTVGVLEIDGRPTLFPIAELVFHQNGDPNSFYSIERKQLHDKEIVCPTDVATDAAEAMKHATLELFGALGCRDLARVDFRLSVTGIPEMLEINPLPGLSPYYGIFPHLAARYGIGNKELIEIIVNNALRRYHERRV